MYMDVESWNLTNLSMYVQALVKSYSVILLHVPTNQLTKYNTRPFDLDC